MIPKTIDYLAFTLLLDFYIVPIIFHVSVGTVSLCPAGWELSSDSDSCVRQLDLTKNPTCPSAWRACAKLHTDMQSIKKDNKIDYPLCFSSSKNCKIIHFGIRKTNGCTKPFNVVCEKPAKETCLEEELIPPCSDGWVMTPEPQGCVSDLGLTRERSWRQARQECRKYGADLITIFNQEINTFILNYNLDRSFLGVWLSLTDQKEDGKWVWHLGNGSSQALNYTNWAKGHPLKSKYKNCAMTRRNNEGWKSVSCDDNHTVVCESPERDYIPSIRYDYKRLSWSDANKLCGQDGDRLLTVRSKRKAKVADEFTQTSQTRHIGLHRTQQDGKWRWPESTNMGDVTYRNWKPGNPKSFKTDRCALFNYDGTWNDINCSKSAFFLCHKPTTVKMGSLKASESNEPCMSRWVVYGLAMLVVLLLLLLVVVICTKSACRAKKSEQNKHSKEVWQSSSSKGGTVQNADNTAVGPV